MIKTVNTRTSIKNSKLKKSSKNNENLIKKLILKKRKYFRKRVM